MPPRSALPPAADQAWNDSEPMRPEPLEHDEPAPLPEPPPRPARPAFAEDMRRAPASERRTEPPLAGFPGEPMGRPEPPMREPPMREPPRAMPRAEPPPLAPRPLRPEPPKAPPPVRASERPAAAMPQAASAADKNLAEMAQRLEAALRRPGANPRAGETSAPVDRVGAPPVAPDAPPRPPARPAAEPAAPAESDSKPSADTPKTQFKNLEDEMASLLGRPKTPS
jgi:hypothetical protein